MEKYAQAMVTICSGRHGEPSATTNTSSSLIRPRWRQNTPPVRWLDFRELGHRFGDLVTLQRLGF
jgi:hypothetical protein